MNTNDSLIGTLLDGRYEVESVIGEGGMAMVYRAMDHRLHRYVAVKVMREDMAADEEFRRRFCAESQAVAMLSHPNIVAVYDVSHSDAMEYIVMELVAGITLKQYMQKKGAVAWREALYFSRQIARALSHAHERGIIHRDIKPQNIMLLQDGTVKVGDFGIAALENELTEQSREGQAIGSLHYIAPEQARGEYPDARSDLYSLGVVMYEMLTGEQPYTGETLAEIAVKHMSAQPAPIGEKAPDVPEELERITMKAMAVDIQSRYQSASELLEDLDSFTQSQVPTEETREPEEPEVTGPAPIRSSTELTKEKYRRRRRRASRVSYMAGTFGVMATVIALFVFLWNFWLGEVFAKAERVELPNFVGTNYETLVGRADLNSVYSFEVVFVVDTEIAPGTVLSQSPDPGRSMMRTSDGIQVELTVSTGITMTQVPEVFNVDYRQASNMIRQAGFDVEVQNVTSDSVTENYVMSTSPAAGEALVPGSVVILYVSSGPEINTLSMPNLVGLTENMAIVQIENSALSYGGSQRVASDLPAGTVIGQSVEAFSPVEEHAKVVIQVSNGPEG